MGTVINCFFIMMLITPVVKGFKIDIPEIKYSQKTTQNRLKDEKEEILQENITANIKEGIRQRLKKIDVIPKKISVLMDTEDTTSISISKIMIVLDKKYLADEIKVKDLVVKETDIQPLVSFE